MTSSQKGWYTGNYGMYRIFYLCLVCGEVLQWWMTFNSHGFPFLALTNFHSVPNFPVGLIVLFKLESPIMGLLENYADSCKPQ